ncbi:AraC family transcriptional regulator [Paenibacillus residui]|uniref:Helix-turn-helix domain-containing protein n=1 Tax=Paenibacillus residui TaxID=629724 RepID=A0ABW3D9M2_9BACL
MHYVRLRLKEEFTVNQIISFHYSELPKNSFFPGEKHDFWEFLYMDKGEAEITAGKHTLHLRQGDLVFYTPNEIHSLKGNGHSAPNIMIVCFECHSPAMNYFKDKCFHLGDRERAILSSLLHEGRLAFDRSYGNKSALLVKRSPAEFGSEQMVKIYLEWLLIQLFRNDNLLSREPRLSTGAKEKTEASIANSVMRYMENHLSGNPTLEEICRHAHVGATRLKLLFKKETGYTLSEYQNKLKIDKAKQYIREETMNYTQIAEKLGYSSVHYFSRHFKKCTGMSPSEYDKSIKARALDFF